MTFCDNCSHLLANQKVANRPPHERLVLVDTKIVSITGQPKFEQIKYNCSVCNGTLFNINDKNDPIKWYESD